MKTYLFSLKEKHYQKILAGTKRHEFRRVFGLQSEPFRGVIYVSSPVKAICASIEFAPAIKLNYSDITNWACPNGYDDDGLLKYFEGKEFGYAMPILSIKLISPSITLQDLRSLIPGFVAPQSYLSLEYEKYLYLISKLGLD
jgi:predicted transcriptional regulator